MEIEKQELTNTDSNSAVAGYNFACGNCKYYKKDIEYSGLGNCSNPEVMGSRIILKYCSEFYLTEDFGCRFFESKL